MSALFHDQVLFICMSFVRKINISLTILVVFESIKFRKNLNKTFPIETGIINLFHYICGIWFIHKNTYLQWQSWNMMMSSKNSLDLDDYFGVLWKILCSTTLMQSFIVWLNWFRIYGGGGGSPFAPLPSLLNVKKTLLSQGQIMCIFAAYTTYKITIHRSYSISIFSRIIQMHLKYT